ncbi:OLC1v1033613C1 [Oldenlandia corymbosa var. corymbosa]|uniref:OLC1v1033613C1 n=1 Tax=Oldenlandia corymbosa var. corymbosa TaxID=529605 RepID=A0AAV1CPB9_OLDCO|nr:OLC1v1033613C1 [Oldenlandia corymbosa var. corymbosa]
MEEGNNQSVIHNACSSTSNNAGNGPNNGEHSGVSSTNSPESHTGEDDILRPGTRVEPYGDVSAVTAGGIDWIHRDEIWSCVAIVFTFGFFVCMVMIMGVYGSVTIILGPNSSILIKPNPLFVEYVEIEESYEEGSEDGTILLYGFHKAPPLDVALTWSETHNITIPSFTHKDWTYHLNQGSHINISYHVINSTNSSAVIFVITRGYEGLSQWIEKPWYPNASLYWEVLQGNGTIQQDIYTSSTYYIALGNLDDEKATWVQLNMSFRSLVYKTTEAYDKCSLTDEGECSVQITLGGGNAALLTSPGPIYGRAVNEWYVKLSYGPRWITYVAVIGGISLAVLGAIHLLSACMNRIGRLFQSGGEIVVVRPETTERNRTPLLLPPSTKDDDLSSWGSSYDSIVSQDDVEYPINEVPQEGKSTKEIVGENNTRRLCVICFDAPRDCFFLPCGHCVACFACSTRIAEAAGTCPICRRPMKKVRKIFTV